MTSRKQLSDRSSRLALITGGSRGMRLQMVEALGQFGAKLVLAAQKEAELENAVGHLRKTAIETDGMTADRGTREVSAIVWTFS